MLSTEFHLAIAPGPTYRRLMAGAATGSWRAAMARPAFAAVLLGITLTIAATSDVNAGLILTTTVMSSLAIAVQMMAGAALVVAAPNRRVDMARSLELLFTGHLPWSLWLLVLSATAALAPGLFDPVLLVGAAAAMAWTCVIVAAFSRNVLYTSAFGAWLRTALHQAIVWIIALAYLWWASALTPRLLAVLGQ